jgi:hypothetical protein
MIVSQSKPLAGGGISSSKRHRDTPPEIHGTGPVACQHHAEPGGEEV